MNKKRRVAYNLKELREYVGLTQQELAWKAGISSVYVSLLEAREKKLTTDAAYKIAGVYLDLMEDNNLVKSKNYEEMSEAEKTYYEEMDKQKEMEDEAISEQERLRREYEEDLEYDQKKKKVAKELIAFHRASYYPEELQDRIIHLTYQIEDKENELNYILENKELLPEDYNQEDKIYDDLSIKDMIKISNKEDTVRDNVEKLKDEYRNREKKV